MKNQENKKTWLNRLENYMSTFNFEFNTKDVRYKWVIEKKWFNIDWIIKDCFVARIHIYKDSCNSLLLRQTKDNIWSIDEAIEQINTFFKENFFSDNICTF